MTSPAVKYIFSDGTDSACVGIHAALEMVSESVRDLLKHQQFKTNVVILPSLQLVQCVKGIPSIY